ncbi:MAG: 30S ribosomal protein S6 [Thermoanaerobaculales bacterium]|jgi:small subunit ribosomal protein S6|nr:30S ribosomal protein S6 [Thermoanaerobaculales bacterium]
MPLYEMGIIVDPEVPPEDEAAALERLEAIITAADGKIVEKDARGRRQLAYPIKKKNYGVYHFWTFEVGGDILEKLNFELRTNDAVMRSLILNLDRELKRKRKLDKKRDDRAAKKAAKRAAAAEAEASADES